MRGREGAKKSVSNSRLTTNCLRSGNRGENDWRKRAARAKLHRAVVRTGAGWSDAAYQVMPVVTRNFVSDPFDREMIDRRETASQIGQLGKRHLVALPDIVEQRAHPRRHLMVHAELFGQRIDVVAFLLEREMEVRSARQSRRTDKSNHLPHMNPRIRVNVGADAGQMSIDAGHAALMLDANRVAEFPGPPRLLDLAVGHGFYRRAVLGD